MITYAPDKNDKVPTSVTLNTIIRRIQLQAPNAGYENGIIIIPDDFLMTL